MTGESAETLTKSKHFVLSVFLLKANFQPNSVTGANTKRSPLSRLLTSGSASTLNGGGEEENLSAYFEPFGSALVPCAPGNRDSIASCESDSLLIKEEKKEAADCDKEVNINRRPFYSLKSSSVFLEFLFS